MTDGRDQATAMTGYAPVGADDELAPGTVVDQFRIEKKLGRGGMSTVYGAVHEVIGKRGALKVLRRELCTDQKEVGRFVQEARAVNQIGHANIVDVFAFGTLPDGRSYLIMEWLVGDSLRTRMARGPMTRHEVRDIFLDIIRALEATHAKGIIHRDLKPDNVFLVETPGEPQPMRAKLLDFGVAKLTGEGRHDRTRAGSMLGTPTYLAPEQARGEADHRSDIYALGIMLFELVSGRPPFQGENTFDVVSMHMMEKPPRLSSCASGVSQELDDLVDAMLAKDPADRPALIRVRATIENIVKRSPKHVPSTGMRTQPARSGLGIKLAIAGLVGALVVVLAVFFLRSGNQKETRAERQEDKRERREERQAQREARRDEAAESRGSVRATPPQASPPAAAKGTLLIQWNGGAGARFTIDGKPVDPNEPIALEPGRYKVAAIFKTKIEPRMVTITEGKTTTLSIQAPTRAPSREVDDPLDNGLR